MFHKRLASYAADSLAWIFDRLLEKQYPALYNAVLQMVNDGQTPEQIEEHFTPRFGSDSITLNAVYVVADLHYNTKARKDNPPDENQAPTW